MIEKNFPSGQAVTSPVRTSSRWTKETHTSRDSTETITVTKKDGRIVMRTGWLKAKTNPQLRAEALARLEQRRKEKIAAIRKAHTVKAGPRKLDLSPTRPPA